MKLILILSIIPIIFHVASSKLLFVYEHFRHGARGPCDGLDKDGLDYLKIKWSSLGELTGIGMRMHYILGYRNHLKYKTFLSQSLDPREILIYSTDLNRTITSALSHLQGLYPHSTGPILSESQSKVALPPNAIAPPVQEEIDKLSTSALPNQIQVTPIHIFNTKDHEVLLHDASDCLPINPTREKKRQKEAIKTFTNQFNKDYGEKFIQYYQWNKDHVMTWQYINYWCDHFIADITEGRDLNAFEKMPIDLKVMTETCHENLRMQLFEVVFGDEGQIVSLMSMSPTYKKILHHMKMRVVYDQNNKGDTLHYEAPRFVIHSAHDTTLGGMQTYINHVFPQVEIVNPKYASNLFFELHKKNEGECKGDLSDYYVEYYYEDKLMMTVGYEEFTEKIEKVMWTQEKINNYCGYIDDGKHDDDDGNNDEFWLWVTIWVLIAFIIALIVGIIVMYMKMGRNYKRESRYTLPESIEDKN